MPPTSSRRRFLQGASAAVAVQAVANAGGEKGISLPIGDRLGANDIDLPVQDHRAALSPPGRRAETFGRPANGTPLSPAFGSSLSDSPRSQSWASRPLARR